MTLRSSALRYRVQTSLRAARFAEIGSAFGAMAVGQAMDAGGVSHRAEPGSAAGAPYEHGVDGKQQHDEDDGDLDAAGTRRPGEQAENDHTGPRQVISGARAHLTRTARPVGAI